MARCCNSTEQHASWILLCSDLMERALGTEYRGATVETDNDRDRRTL